MRFHKALFFFFNINKTLNSVKCNWSQSSLQENGRFSAMWSKIWILVMSLIYSTKVFGIFMFLNNYFSTFIYFSIFSVPNIYNPVKLFATEHISKGISKETIPKEGMMNVLQTDITTNINIRKKKRRFLFLFCLYTCVGID